MSTSFGKYVKTPQQCMSLVKKLNFHFWNSLFSGIAVVDLPSASWYDPLPHARLSSTTCTAFRVPWGHSPFLQQANNSGNGEWGAPCWLRDV